MSIVIILDCGATNVRAIAVNDDGNIIASHYIANETLQNGTNHVWDYQQIWAKLVKCCNQVTAQINSQDICAVSVTTFGVDGAPFDKNGQQIYPVISWKCSRTASVMYQVEKELNRSKLYQDNGIGDYSFNTLYKLKWLKENEPLIYSNMDKFVFISSMITHDLTGELTTDRTMAGTSMLTDLESGEWRQETLDYLALTKDSFPPLVNAGDVVGKLKADIADLLGFPLNTPVISSGHDTQFALFGSGAKVNQPFLSSGTWEILMARSPRPQLKPEYLKKGMTTELDSKTGIYNPAIQWLSSAVMEWVASTFFGDVVNQENKYALMISEGESAPIGCNGTTFNAQFLLDDQHQGKGFITGLSMNTTRGEIYRAALEGLAIQLNKSLTSLSEICDFKADSLIVVGGGSRNRLWNQIRADVLGIPILVVDQAESTVLGAAMYAFAGVSVYATPDEAQDKMKPTFTVVNPSDNTALYSKKLLEVQSA
ncbi:L-fuculokinase [Psychromonas hadalis]|uniref:L-fuculokinase n=1 Tax=Psychromonas hadalis TaxID=211669 RepID=UPI0003B44CD0|nr:L-fuculokinase [Psychromonas hadalis]